MSLRRMLAALALVTLRGSLRRRAVHWLEGWEVDDTARIGKSWIDADRVIIGPQCVIASATIVRGLALLHMDSEAHLGPFNWISGPGLHSGLYPHCPDRLPALTMHRGASITSRHRLDCSDHITFDEFSLMAGFGSQILTHGLEFTTPRQRTGPVRVGFSSVLMSRVLVLPGVDVADRVLVAAGAVVAESLPDGYTLYAGVPARPKKALAPDLAYFDRVHRSVD